MEEVSRFALDYTFWLNLAGAVLAGALVELRRRFQARHGGGAHDHGGGGLKRAFAWAALAVWGGGALSWLWTVLTG
jgi:hypothetical protein